MRRSTERGGQRPAPPAAPLLPHPRAAGRRDAGQEGGHGRETNERLGARRAAGTSRTPSPLNKPTAAPVPRHGWPCPGPRPPFSPARRAAGPRGEETAASLRPGRPSPRRVRRAGGRAAGGGCGPAGTSRRRVGWLSENWLFRRFTIVAEDYNVSKEMQELQKQWHSMVLSFHSNSNVVAFMNSRLGQYLDDHPFVALSLLMFIAVSAIPIAFFLIFVVTTAVMACISVIVMEGVVIAIGGIALLCVLCGLGALSLGVSGVLTICYVVLSTLLNYWYASRDQIRKQEVNGSLPQKRPSGLDLSASNGKSE